MSSFKGKERSTNSTPGQSVMGNGKSQNHAKGKGAVDGPKGLLAQDSSGLQAPFGSLVSEDAKRIPSMLPPKPPKLAV